ncbi:MAG: MogA/MoaB family molybdenum cofactor biosynthesis protein [Anaerolineae bacterium]|nr:MogA/MoaB family molybdenum cofactor biosynthesis protein [Anaerolineae bacterium]MDK1117188.1 MogA/MoaB family molybdenum cofactor biosynthesis protein [Anaerolineae bacterium]
MNTIRFGILTVSDRSFRKERPDSSGPALVKLVKANNWQITNQEIVPDEMSNIEETLQTWSDSGDLDVILTTGGTGFSPRDITPEATRSVVERLTPGLDEVMRATSLKVTPHAMLSRATSGIRKRTLIINLPGSPKGAKENFQAVLPAIEHAIVLIKDANSGH